MPGASGEDLPPKPASAMRLRLNRVTELRLERARAVLESPANGRRKMIDIAYSCAFNDLSYFNRCFRRRFGAAPSQFRGAKAD